MRRVEECNDRFDYEAYVDGYAQNLGKQVIVPDLRSHKQNRRFQVLYSTRSAVSQRHLGGLFVASGACSTEVSFRIEAGNRGLRELGKFWFSHVNYRVKRLLFLGKVYSAVLSGMLSYDLGTRDLSRLKKSITGKLRAVMQGRACSDKGDKGHRVALSTGAVLRYFKIAPVHVELFIGRVRMYFSWIREPRRHEHCLAVLFGRYGFESSDTVGPSDGQLAEGANSFPRRFVDHMREVVRVGEGVEWSGDLRTFFVDDRDESFVAGVLAVDPRVFRSRFLSAAWAPPGWVEEDDSEEGEVEVLGGSSAGSSVPTAVSARSTSTPTLLSLRTGGRLRAARTVRFPCWTIVW